MRGWLHAGSALIRSVLHLDPDAIGDAEWCYQVKMAVWAEQRQARNVARIIAGE